MFDAIILVEMGWIGTKFMTKIGFVFNGGVIPSVRRMEMKKIINGLVYDTEKAKLLASCDNNLQYTDFFYFEERLYKKRTGEFFLYGSGGANSRYGVWHGNSGGPGEKIMPISSSEAVKWAEENLDGDNYEEIFGNPEPDDGKAPLNLYVSNRTKSLLQQLSSDRGISISAVVEELVSKK